MVQKVRSYILLILLFLALCVSAQAATQVVSEVSGAAQQEQLSVQGYLYWQQINQMRMNPYPQLERLGISREQAHQALGKDAWVLYFGLPPLAWSDLLVQTAAGHGRDMIDRLYYSYDTLEGETPLDRVFQVGYDPQTVNESLGLLGLDSYMNYERAISVLIDSLLRDELTGATGEKNTILSPDVTEIGISVFAETLDKVSGQPDIFLLVMDAARPTEQRPWIVGQVDEGYQVVLRNMEDEMWENLPILPGHWFQFSPPSEGVDFSLIDPEGFECEYGEYFQEGNDVVRFLDLRDIAVSDQE